MTPELSLLITIAAGAIGGWLGHRLGVPSGALFGSILVAGVVNMSVDGLVPLDPRFRLGAQIAIGTVLGASLTRSPFAALRPVLVPVTIAVAAILATAGGVAVVVHEVTGLPLITSLFAFAPGGASEMTSAALNLDANVPLIAAIHVLRQVVVFVVVGSALTYCLRARAGKE